MSDRVGIPHLVCRGAPSGRPGEGIASTDVFPSPAHSGRASGAPLQTIGDNFPLFHHFPNLRIGIFGKDAHCSSDEECAKLLGFERVATLHQVHGNVIHIAEEVDGIVDGDGLITQQANLALSVRFADCQAFVIYAPLRAARFGGQAPRQAVLGVLHVGWRGLAKRAITAFYETLRERFSIAPEETYVGATPSLCKKCAEFSDPYRELPAHLHPFIEGKNVDLVAAAEVELDTLGVPRSQRERHTACTKCDARFWSHRRGERGARNYLVAGLVEQRRDLNHTPTQTISSGRLARP